MACRCRKWVCWGMWWPKLAQVGGLSPFKFEKVLPASAGSLKKKLRPTTGIHRPAGREPPRTTLSGSAAPSAPQRRSKGLRTGTCTEQNDMVQGMIRGSNTPWAKGPANLIFYPQGALWIVCDKEISKNLRRPYGNLGRSVRIYENL